MIRVIKKGDIMEKLSHKQVKHVAHLARLSLTEEETEGYSVQLGSILTEIDKIIDVEIDEKEDIMIAPTQNKNRVHPDEVGEMLDKEAIFANVKHRSGDYIVVPKVIHD